MSSATGAIVHRNVGVIACDTAVTLQETLHRLEELELTAVQIGDRHLIMPADEIPAVLECLKEHGQFPRLLGELLRDGEADAREGAESSDGGDDDGAAGAEESSTK